MSPRGPHAGPSASDFADLLPYRDPRRFEDWGLNRQNRNLVLSCFSASQTPVRGNDALITVAQRSLPLAIAGSDCPPFAAAFASSDDACGWAAPRAAVGRSCAELLAARGIASIGGAHRATALVECAPSKRLPSDCPCPKRRTGDLKKTPRAYLAHELPLATTRTGRWHSNPPADGSERAFAQSATARIEAKCLV